jgi:hypothetical protein
MERRKVADLENKGDIEVKFGNRTTGESYNAVSVGSTATQIVASNSIRRYVMIFNASDKTVYVGFDNSVTTSNGVPILRKAGIIIDQTEVNIYGIVASGTADVRYLEV